MLLLFCCPCLEEDGVPAAPSPFPYNLANSDPETTTMNFYSRAVTSFKGRMKEPKIGKSQKYERQKIPMKAASKSQGPKRWRREEHLGLAGEGSGVGWSGRVPANDNSH